jgi:hypothetical protein
MSDEITRRRFVVAAIAGSGALSGGLTLAFLDTATAWASASPEEKPASARALGRAARLLYPHAAIADDVYAAVVDDILAAAASDPALATTLDEAMAALDGAREPDFLALDGEDRLAVMTALQEEPWFSAIRLQVLVRLYSRPQLWQLIRYPGSSVEHGGYVDRGFDDIDWLPEGS